MLYYAVPPVFVVLLLAALRLRPERRIGLVMAGVAFTMSMYAGEVVLHLLEPSILRAGLPVMASLNASKERKEIAAMLESRFGIAIDSRDSLEVLRDLRRNGIEAVPSVIPRYQLRHYQKEGVQTPPVIALGGIPNKVTVLCNENGQFVTYDSDQHGFRNPKEILASGRVDIVALGDSFTQGYCVPSGKTFVDLVRQRHPSTLNLGMAGEGPLLMLATLKEYAAPLRPRLVLWFYFEGNDLVDLMDERKSALLMRYLEGGFTQKLEHRQDEINRALIAFVEKEREWAQAQREAQRRNATGPAAGLIDFLRLPLFRTRLGLIQGRSAKDEQFALELEKTELPLFRRILSDAKANVASWDGALYFVYLPNWARYDRDRRTEYHERVAEATREAVLAMVRDLGLPLVDLVPAFDAHGDAMSLFPFRAPGHYTEGGHALVGKVVLDRLATSAQASGK